MRRSGVAVALVVAVCEVVGDDPYGEHGAAGDVSIGVHQVTRHVGACVAREGVCVRERVCVCPSFAPTSHDPGGGGEENPEDGKE